MPVQKSLIEPRKGGRWYTTHEDGSETVVGHMLVWEPPHRIVFTWVTPNKGNTEVDVRFTPVTGGTRVEVEHRGLELMGGEGHAFGTGWDEVLACYQALADA